MAGKMRAEMNGTSKLGPGTVQNQIHLGIPVCPTRSHCPKGAIVLIKQSRIAEENPALAPKNSVITSDFMTLCF